MKKITFLLTICSLVQKLKNLAFSIETEPSKPEIDKPFYMLTKIKKDASLSSVEYLKFGEEVEGIELLDIIYTLGDGSDFQPQRTEQKDLIIFPKFFTKYPTSIKITATYRNSGSPLELTDEFTTEIYNAQDQKLTLLVNYTSQDVYCDDQNGATLAAYAYDADIQNYKDSTQGIQFEWDCIYLDSSPCNFDFSSQKGTLKIPKLSLLQQSIHVIKVTAIKYSTGLVELKRSESKRASIIFGNIQLNFFGNENSIIFDNFYFNGQDGFQIRSRVYGGINVQEEWNNSTRKIEGSELREWSYTGGGLRYAETEVDVSMTAQSFDGGKSSFSVKGFLKLNPKPGYVTFDVDSVSPFRDWVGIEAKGFLAFDSFFGGNGPQSLEFSYGYCSNYFEGSCIGKEHFSKYFLENFGKIRLPYLPGRNVYVGVRVRGRFKNEVVVYKKVYIDEEREYSEIMEVYEIFKQERNQDPRNSGLSLVTLLYSYYNQIDDKEILADSIAFFKGNFAVFTDYNQIANYLTSLHLCVQGLKRLSIPIESEKESLLEIIDGFLPFRGTASTTFSQNLHQASKDRHLDLYNTRELHPKQWTLKSEILLTVFSLALNLLDYELLGKSDTYKSLRLAFFIKINHYLRIDTNNPKLEFRLLDSTFIIGKFNGQNQYKFDFLTKTIPGTNYQMSPYYLKKTGDFYQREHHEDQLLGAVLPNVPMINEDFGVRNSSDLDSLTERGYMLEYFTADHLFFRGGHTNLTEESRISSLKVYTEEAENFELKDLKENISIFIPISSKVKEEAIRAIQGGREVKILSCFSQNDVDNKWQNDCRGAWFNSTSAVNSYDVENSVVCSCSHLSFFSFSIEDRTNPETQGTMSSRFYSRPFFISNVLLLTIWAYSTIKNLLKERNTKILDVSYLNSLTCIRLKMLFPGLVRIKQLQNVDLQAQAKKLILLLSFWSKIEKIAQRYEKDPMFLSDEDTRFLDYAMRKEQGLTNDGKEVKEGFFNIGLTFLGKSGDEDDANDEYIVDRYKKWRELSNEDIKRIKGLERLKIAKEEGDDFMMKSENSKKKKDGSTSVFIDYAFEYSKDINRLKGENLLDNVKVDNKLETEAKIKKDQEYRLLAINRFFKRYNINDQNNEMSDLQKANFLKIAGKQLTKRDKDILNDRYKEEIQEAQEARKRDEDKWRSLPLERRLMAKRNPELHGLELNGSEDRMKEEKDDKEFRKLYNKRDGGNLLDDDNSDNDSTHLSDSFSGNKFKDLGKNNNPRKRKKAGKKSDSDRLSKKQRKRKERLERKKANKLSKIDGGSWDLFFSTATLFFKNHELISLFCYKDPFNPTYLRISYSFVKIFSFYFYQIFLYSTKLKIIFDNGDYIRAAIINPILTLLITHLTLSIFKPFLLNNVHFVYYQTVAYLIRCRKTDEEFLKKMVKKFKSKSVVQFSLCFAIGFTYASYSVYFSVVDYKYINVPSSFIFLGFCACMLLEYTLKEFIRIMINLDTIFKTTFAYLNKENKKPGDLNHQMVSLFMLKLKQGSKI